MNCVARQVIIETHMENAIMVDVARRYYPVDELKQYIDALAEYDNGTLQIHFTDDENVGIECDFLDQTVENATLTDGVYYNNANGKPFLSFVQVSDLMSYAAEREVRIVPEIDMPAHMKGFLDLARLKFGDDYVLQRYSYDDIEHSGIGWQSGDEAGNLDIYLPQGRQFAYNLLDEYTEFFSGLEYFHIGFDEYTLRPELKVEFANELYDYVSNKGFKVRMWSDAITKANVGDFNNNFEITYWGWKQADITETNYATVPDLQNAGFKVLITNKYYLFFVPTITNTTDEVLADRISRIENNWDLTEWNYNFGGTLENHDNILGAMVCNWGEESDGVPTNLITSHTIDMYRAMFPKVDVYRETIDIPDEEPEEEPIEDWLGVPDTGIAKY